jgi:hypothetical protein|tara:strand:- start:171 stop:407 length:237 start_codon:yes stop_codon:yes gene_type:complete
MSYNSTKTTSRFQFGITRNNTAKKAGSNVVTIATRAVDGQQYAVGTTQLQMTVKEAIALQAFLNDSLGDASVSDSNDM